ncbi:hypothetical protein BIT28_07240 [Photobacterium proteolyticum]|uniref:DUF2946 domain-containing protein n=1 Tax=Photobacterium proteolyticum TaxID=1903952 RepID=A0A1Q9GEY6_9GAMM|nr:hypothetical protein [Photobacterium proteolyticum]OLQ72967.1 hypothetical protein BIT28_07240 [Photobacterium proteolyticum]
MRFSDFNKTMLLVSALSWVLVTMMPVINAHGANAGVWATLCTVNGFERILIEEGKPDTHAGKPCPFSHFSTFHYDRLPTAPLFEVLSYVISDSYTYLALSVRFERQVPRAPPSRRYS